MANTNATMGIDETLESQLQELMSNLGMYGLQAYKLAKQNTSYNKNGKAVISSDDEWKDETEWDDMFEQMHKREYYNAELFQGAKSM